MNLGKIKNKIQTEQFCNKIIQQNKLEKKNFYNLSRYQQRSRSKSHQWYGYKRIYKINYSDIIGCQTGEFRDYQYLKFRLIHKYNYWKQYMQEITNIQVQIIVQQEVYIQLLGSYYSEQQYSQMCVIMVRTKQQTFYKNLRQDQFIKYLKVRKCQTQREKQIKVILKGQQIVNYFKEK